MGAYLSFMKADLFQAGHLSDLKDLVPLHRNKVLCGQCSLIDFESVFRPSNRVKDKNGTFVAALGYRISSTLPDCPLCRLFHAIRFPQTRSEERTKGYDLWAYSSLNSSQQFLFRSIQEYQQMYDSVFLAVVPHVEKAGLLDFSVVKRHCWNAGYIARIADPPGTGWKSSQSKEFGARIVPPLVDYAVLRSWITWCEDHHSNGCHRGSHEYKLQNLKLIDCKTRTLVSTEDVQSVPYVALSYVWGAPGGPKPKKMYKSISATNPASLHSLPRVIEDAITVTLNLGFQYLWVDRYCINQGNQEEKMTIIAEMHLIYKSAAVTIVEAAGTDGDYGLVGVSDLYRQSQPTVAVKGEVLISTLPHPSHRIKYSKWCSRGWTYQEAVFSRRRLVFTTDQVYFECKSMNCFESIQIPLEIFHIKDQSRYRRFIRSGMFDGNDEAIRFRPFADESMRHTNPRILQYMVHVENYSPRQLTNSDDCLNAFRGIMQDFSQEQIPVYSLFGLPVQSDLGKKGNMLTATITAALTWRHTQTMPLNSGHKPRANFPSWSWTGWEGGVHFPLKHQTPGIDMSKIRDGFTEYQIGITFYPINGPPLWIAKMSDTVLLENTETLLKPLLRFDAWMLHTSTINLAIENNKLRCHISRDLAPGKKGVEDAMENIKNGTWSCLVLGYLGDHLDTVMTYLPKAVDALVRNQATTFLLLVEGVRGGMFQRVGMCELQGFGRWDLEKAAKSRRSMCLE